MLEPYVREMQEQYPQFRTVWLMTEDEAVVNATRQYPQYVWLFTTAKRDNRGEFFRIAEEVDSITRNSLVNLFIAAEADAFIGTLSSTWGRLVVLLAWGLRGRPPSCSSLHGSWDYMGHGFAGCLTYDGCRIINDGHDDDPEVRRARARQQAFYFAILAVFGTLGVAILVRVGRTRIVVWAYRPVHAP
jgi:hypothetical protein